MRKTINERFQVLWEGTLSLRKINWHTPLLHEYLPPKEYESAIKANWKEHKIKYPNDYDGISLFLYDYKFSDDGLTLSVGTIKFSVIVFLYKNNIPVNKGLGTLGVQSLVLSPDRTHFLVGRRSSHQEYYPRSLTMPGGISEERDFKLPPFDSLMREVKEEIPLPVESESFLTAILTGWNCVSSTFLISTVIRYSDKFSFGEVVSGEPREWDGTLRWVDSAQLKEMDYKDVIDGLYYYKWKLHNELC